MPFSFIGKDIYQLPREVQLGWGREKGRRGSSTGYLSSSLSYSEPATLLRKELQIWERVHHNQNRAAWEPKGGSEVASIYLSSPIVSDS